MHACDRHRAAAPDLRTALRSQRDRLHELDASSGALGVVGGAELVLAPLLAAGVEYRDLPSGGHSMTSMLGSASMLR